MICEQPDGTLLDDADVPLGLVERGVAGAKAALDKFNEDGPPTANTDLVLRAVVPAALLAALDPEEFKVRFGLVAQYQYAALTNNVMSQENSVSIADAFVTQLRQHILAGDIAAK